MLDLAKHIVNKKSGSSNRRNSRTIMRLR
jgi:hypothetical protein